MPAIQPARLKQQASDLAEKFVQPAIFVRDLHSLLDFYTDHTHRKGQAGEPSPLLSAYKAPAPVMRQVWLELIPVIKQNPGYVLPVCDALWEEPNFDLQVLAARLLGQVPADSSELVIDRLREWINRGMEKHIMDTLFEYSLQSLQQSSSKKMLELVSTWLNSAEQIQQQAGLRSLHAMVDRTGTEHLPTIYRLITPFLRIAPSRLRPDILAVLSALIKCSPSETAFLLRQNLSAPDNPDTPWIIRQVLTEFPEDSRSGLRQAMKVSK